MHINLENYLWRLFIILFLFFSLFLCGFFFLSFFLVLFTHVCDDRQWLLLQKFCRCCNVLEVAIDASEL
uniref:Uncharacterized protein n=1 Tax=Lotus japonicus TaxID=34305 RepID=I3S9K6_LOTJA|nr:unknown [Lotus japonicus]